MEKLVIKGAYYHDAESDTILIPHYTGTYIAVDCDAYVTMDKLSDIYDEEYIDSVKDDFVTYSEERYYSAEFGTYHVREWELLSDLSNLHHSEEDFDW